MVEPKITVSYPLDDERFIEAFAASSVDSGDNAKLIDKVFEEARKVNRKQRGDTGKSGSK